MNDGIKREEHGAVTALDRAIPVDDLAELDWLADLGEIVGPVTHEFNNFLNTLLLQVAVMELAANDKLKSELQCLKRQGKQLAAIVRQVQQYRRCRAGEAPPACLNRAVTDATEAAEQAPARLCGAPRVRRTLAAGAGVVPLRLSLAEGLPPVSGPAADLRRMCRFLLNGAAWTVAGRGSLVLTTTPAGGGAVLRLKADGAEPGSLVRLLDGAIDSEGGARAGIGGVPIAGAAIGRVDAGGTDTGWRVAGGRAAGGGGPN